MKVWVMIVSEKRLDRKGRWRNVTIAFRVSPEENKLINHYVEVSGLTKQEFLTSNMLKKQINVMGNPRVYKALKKNMLAICKELNRINDSSEIDDDFKDFMKYVFEIYERLGE